MAMTREDGRVVLARMEALAVHYDRQGDVVLRNQTVRQMADVGGVSDREIKAAQRRIMSPTKS